MIITMMAELRQPHRLRWMLRGGPHVYLMAANHCGGSVAEVCYISSIRSFNVALQLSTTLYH